MLIGNKARPLRVDVELHGSNRPSALQDPGQAGDGLVVGSGVDQIATWVDPHAGTPHPDSVAERVTPLQAVVETRVQSSAVENERQALASENDRGPCVRSPIPSLC